MLRIARCPPGDPRLPCARGRAEPRRRVRGPAPWRAVILSLTFVDGLDPVAGKAFFTLLAALLPLIQWRSASGVVMSALPLLEELEGALASGDAGRRRDILAPVPHLFLNAADRYSEDQVDVFGDVMARLVTTIEAKARAK